MHLLLLVGTGNQAAGRFLILRSGQIAGTFGVAHRRWWIAEAPTDLYIYVRTCVYVYVELLSANGGRFKINQLLFADDTVLVADSEEKFWRLMSKFGRVCERRKLRVNVGQSKVMWCSRYGNGDRMHVILNGEPIEEVDCFKYQGSQGAADGDVRGMWYTE